MADVGIRELRHRLSEYLDRAAAGETLRVTDRGRPKAMIVPLPGAGRLEQGVEEGWVRPGSGHLPRRASRIAAVRSSEEVLAEDRGT